MKFLIVKLPAVLIEMFFWGHLVNDLCREWSKSSSQHYCRKCLTDKLLYRSSTAVQILTILFPCIFSELCFAKHVVWNYEILSENFKYNINTIVELAIMNVIQFTFIIISYISSFTALSRLKFPSAGFLHGLSTFICTLYSKWSSHLSNCCWCAVEDGGWQLLKI